MDIQGKLLVIDDEKGIRDGCSRVLEPAGFVVSKAATLHQGLQVIQQGEFDLVLLDVMMPDGRGVDLLEPMHQADPDLVVIIITGYATVELAVEAIRLGAYDFISKPFTADQLLLTVNQGLEKRRLSQETRRLQQIEQQAAELAQAKAQMERLDQQKSLFMTTIAHELRSPISGAQSLARTILHGAAGELNEQQVQMLTRIENRLQILLELVNDLLDLAATKTLEAETALQPVPLPPILQAVFKHFEIEAQVKRLQLNLELPAAEPVVLGTPEGLERIFVNLVGNALKYTPAQGKVEIRAQAHPHAASIAVADTGIGIPAKDLPRLFEEFFRAGNAKRSGITGTGLGLSIVKQLVDHFGGTITVQSQEGLGTTFTVELPLAAGEPAETFPGPVLTAASQTDQPHA